MGWGGGRAEASWGEGLLVMGACVRAVCARGAIFAGPAVCAEVIGGDIDGSQAIIEALIGEGG